MPNSVFKATAIYYLETMKFGGQWILYIQKISI
jgi:hypothetical protein